MKKSKLTYKNEIKTQIITNIQEFFGSRKINDDQKLCYYCVKFFMENVECPKDLFFGGEITMKNDGLLECIITEKDNGYAGKVIFYNPSIIQCLNDKI